MKKSIQFVVLLLTLYSTSLLATTMGYMLTINNDWSSTTHPANFPSDAHFSWLGGGTHNQNVSFWELGSLASPGIVQMAETGRVDILVDTEFQEAIDNGNAFSETIFEKVWTPEVLPGPGSRVTSFQIDSAFPLITLATMLGPSPDWFVGVSGLALFENGAWKDSVTVQLALYDGGSEEGEIPIMNNLPTATQENIHLITYDQASGTYISTTTPHIIGSLVFERVVPVPLPPSLLLLFSSLTLLLGYRRKLHNHS